MFRIPITDMIRAVVRKGKRVEFCNGVGGFAGKTYRYEFPTLTIAKSFEKLANKQIMGAPAPIPPQFRKYEVTDERP